MAADTIGRALGQTSCLLVNAHRLTIAAAIVLDDAGLEPTPELSALFAALGEAATIMTGLADDYGMQKVATSISGRVA